MASTWSTGGACESWWPNGGYAPVGCGGVGEQLAPGSDLTPVPNGAFVGSRGTVKDCTCFNVGRDVDNLRKAIVGLGTNEQAIIEILTHRSNWQRQQICKEYKATCGRELIDDLKGDLSGDFKHVITALVLPPALFDAQELERAMRGPGTNESVLIEILATRSNQQIKEIKEAYRSEYKRELAKDIAAETSGDFRRALLILLEARRDENCQVVDERLFKSDAQALYKAGEKRLGTDEAKFIEVLCLRSPAQLLTINCSKSIPVYFAERIHKSVKGLGTDENTLSRIMVSRSEIDLLDILDEYLKLYGRSLYATIKDETSGDYKNTLLKLCGTGN
ncbi:annexin A3a isoform X2 [Hemiscyllium ocellatum]|uniref:annexin A3a isoform X2 n=1 Tax=Hemiscyllium ocellatum TaxID=170820 RepID=UPI0029668684|nr:annexin A3a isoform X2 [Hemiscyllium ocellatum]